MTNKYNIGDTLRILGINHGGLATEERKKYIGKTFEVIEIDKNSTGICYAGSGEFSPYIFYENEVELNESEVELNEFEDELNNEAIDALIEENMILKDQLIDVQDKLLYYQDLHIEDLLELFNK